MEVPVANIPKKHFDKQKVLVRRISSAQQRSSEDARIKLILQMVKRGCSVLPVVARGKTPAVAGGVHAASKNVNMIKDYFLANANANYGIATGVVSGTFVVDPDGLEGVKNFLRLEKNTGDAHQPLQCGPRMACIFISVPQTIVYQTQRLGSPTESMFAATVGT
jgi:hypothetical protein